MLSATKLRNYLINDPILDWFNLYGEEKGFKKDSKDSYSEFIMNRGNEFEDFIIEKLKCESFIDIKSQFSTFCEEGVIATLDAMKKGYHIIYQGFLEDKEEEIYGIPDLLIRSDYIATLFQNNFPDIFPSNLEYKWSYFVVDIKFSTIHIGKNNRILTHGNIKAYKGQLYIYNKILNNIFEYDQSSAYLLGRRFIKDDNIQNGIEILGEVNMEEENIGDDVENAIEWNRMVRKVGKDWNPFQSEMEEMKPNMKNKMDYPWHFAKMEVAEKTKDLTRIWHINRKKRSQINIRKIRDYFPEKKGKIIDKMLRLDQGMKIKNKYESFKLDTTDKMLFYVDFEYINGSDLFFHHNTRVHLYMIGIGYWKNGWNYDVFIPENIGDYDEKRNVYKWLKFMRDTARQMGYNKYSLVHWTKAEPITFERIRNQWKIREKLEWLDLQPIFKDCGIIVEGMTNFTLKTVAKSLKNAGLINTGWDDVSDALGANLILINGLKSNEKLPDIKSMDKIRNYNETDCKVLFEILHFLSSTNKKNM